MKRKKDIDGVAMEWGMWGGGEGASDNIHRFIFSPQINTPIRVTIINLWGFRTK